MEGKYLNGLRKQCTIKILVNGFTMEGINEWKLTERVKDSFCHFFSNKDNKGWPSRK